MKEGELLLRLRSRGWRITPQRRAVVTVLERGARHATAEEVHTAAQFIVPEISLATVYNVLTELVEMNEVAEVRLGRGAALFDVNVTKHYHCICDTCGRIADVPAADQTCCMDLPELAACCCVAESIEVIFHGHCCGCAPEA